MNTSDTFLQEKTLELADSASVIMNNVVPYGQKATQTEEQPVIINKISSPLPNNRPIAASNMQVVKTNSLPENRPVFVSSLQVLKSESLPPNRPVAASNLEVLPSSPLPHNRPIFSKVFDNIEDIIGYLD